jgi:ATP-dependent Zn protease
MKYVLRAVIIASLSSLAAAEGVYPQEQPVEVTDLIHVNVLLQGSIDKAISSAQHLLQLVSSKKIVAPERIPLAQKWLFDCIERLNALAQSSGGDITLSHIDERSRYLQSVVSAIQFEIDSSFAHCIPLRGVHEYRSPGFLDEEYDVDEVFGRAARAAQEAEVLSQSMSTVGLTWYNKAYTAVSGINHRYHITSTAYEAAKISIAGLSAAWAGMILYTMLPDSMKRSVFSVDTREKLNGLTKKFISSENLGGVNQAIMMTKGSLEAATMGLGLISGWSLWDKVGNQLRKFDGFLRGGEPVQKRTGLERILMKESGLTLDDPQFDPMRRYLSPFYDILEFLKNPPLFINAGNCPPKAIIVTGASGNGKTFIAQALHGSVNKQSIVLGKSAFNFFSLTPNNFSVWGGAAVRELQDIAREYAPCIIFIDEFHNCNLQTQGNGELLAQFLTFIDDINQENDPNKIVILITATNRVELLDQALYRANRLGVRMQLDNPKREERLLMLEAFCKKSGVDTQRIDLNHIARITEGASRSALNKICKDAGFAAKSHQRGITFDDFYQAVNGEMRKHRPEQSLSPLETKAVAAYQAGAAVVALLTKDAPALESVTIGAYLPNPDEQYDFMTKMRVKQDKKKNKSPNKMRYGMIYAYRDAEAIKPGNAETRALIKVLLAGALAHEIVCCDIPSYRSKDRRRAFDYALDVVLEGLPITSLSESEQNARRDRAQKLIEDSSREVRALLQSYEKQLLELVRELQEKGMLRVERVREIIIG